MKEQFVLNITAVYNLATSEEKSFGNLWYSYVHNQLRDIATQYNISFDAVVDATAALSPGIRWESNIRGIELLVHAVTNGTYSTVTGIAGYRRNIDKAAAILFADINNAPFRHILSGPKVTAFSDNIRNGNDDNKVTVDVHAYSIAMGERFTVNDMPSISVSIRNAMIQAYREVASMIGVSPKAIQAVTWVTWRRIHGIK